MNDDLWYVVSDQPIQIIELKAGFNFGIKMKIVMYKWMNNVILKLGDPRHIP